MSESSLHESVKLDLPSQPNPLRGWRVNPAFVVLVAGVIIAIIVFLAMSPGGYPQAGLPYSASSFIPLANAGDTLGAKRPEYYGLFYQAAGNNVELQKFSASEKEGIDWAKVPKVSLPLKRFVLYTQLLAAEDLRMNDAFPTNGGKTTERYYRCRVYPVVDHPGMHEIEFPFLLSPGRYLFYRETLLQTDYWAFEITQPGQTLPDPARLLTPTR